MAYIGRGIENLVNAQKLDAITPSTAIGAGPYNLTKDSVAFVPASADQMVISINGVIQYGNFTVSGSTVTFSGALTDSDTCDFIYQMGTGLLTTPVDGSVNTAQLANDSITTAKILDANVTTSKIADDNVTTSKIADGNVTSAKLSYPLTTFSSTGIDDNATSTAITIDSSENVGIGGVPDAGGKQKLLVQGSDAVLVMSEVENLSGPVNFQLTADDTEDCRVTFGDKADNSRGRIVYSNTSEHMRFEVNNLSEAMRIDSSGHAIIPAGVTLGTSAGTYNASNTLDDYEEGTWTPQVTASSGGTPIYQVQDGRYTKIGNVVILVATLQFVKNTLSGTSIQLTNFPFTSANHAQGSTLTWGRNFATSFTPSLIVSGNSTLATIYKLSTNTSAVALTDSDLKTSGASSNDIRFQITYIAT